MKRTESRTSRWIAFLAFIVCCAQVQAQSGTAAPSASSNKNVKGSGTAGQVPVWTAPDTIGDSSIIERNGNVGIGTATPGSKLSVVGRIEAFVIGISAGVLGQSSAGSGVRGNSDTGLGVFGSSDTGFGTRGTSNSSFGVFGSSQSSDGVFGQSNSSNGNGVAGLNSNNGGTGVLGQGGTGVRGISSNGFGVWGTSTTFTAVQAQSDSGFGVFGSSNSNRGVHGQSNSNTGVHGQSNSGFGVFGSSGSGTGVFGVNTAGGTGVVGQGGTGVVGSGSGNGSGVFGSSPESIGVFGISENGIAGVFGSSGSGSGVTGFSISGPAIHGVTVSNSGVAGLFNGDVNISGNLSKGGGSFKIDHPLDPANKYLYHSFVESPDMMNIYNGNVTTDGNGEATVALPNYFEALNKDFRYQLTVIGQFAQAIVAAEIKDNRFQIKTDKADVKVSWQVTGIRQDAWANKHRIPTEVEKPEAERGYYLHPELYDQPAEQGIEWARKPELMRRTRVLQLQRPQDRDPLP